MKKNKKQYCQNCVNKRKPRFNLQIGGLKIQLCKNCWIGITYGLKQDFEEFNINELGFIQRMEETKKSEKN